MARGWVDDVALPTWEFARSMLLPGTLLWSAYEISGRFRSDSDAEKSQHSKERSEAMAAALSAFVAVGMIGGSAWYFANKRR